VTERRHHGAVAEAVLREAALARLATGDPRGAARRSLPLAWFARTRSTRTTTSYSCGAWPPAAKGSPPRGRWRGARGSSAASSASNRARRSPPPLKRSPRPRPQARSAGGPPRRRSSKPARRPSPPARSKPACNAFRRAVSDARAARDAELHAQALVALGSALVHAARGQDEEAAAALHEALAIAVRLDLTSLAAAASRELGHVEFLQGRYWRAAGWLARGEALAGENAAERGRLGSIQGSVLSDTAQYAAAVERLRKARRLSALAGDWRQASYTLSMLGRAHLLCGELGAAATALDEALELARRENWLAFTPWPDALRADVDLARGDLDAAAERYEHAFALGCHPADPCWEGIAARGIGLVAASRGQPQKALEWLREARRRAARLPDAYLWVKAYTLDALCSIGVAHEVPAAPTWVEELAELAGRTGMRELVARAYAHRARLGAASALTTAWLLAARIDNPALSASLTSRLPLA